MKTYRLIQTRQYVYMYVCACVFHRIGIRSCSTTCGLFFCFMYTILLPWNAATGRHAFQRQQGRRSAPKSPSRLILKGNGGAGLFSGVQTRVPQAPREPRGALGNKTTRREYCAVCKLPGPLDSPPSRIPQRSRVCAQKFSVASPIQRPCRAKCSHASGELLWAGLRGLKAVIDTGIHKGCTRTLKH